MRAGDRRQTPTVDLGRQSRAAFRHGSGNGDDGLAAVGRTAAFDRSYSVFLLAAMTFVTMAFAVARTTALRVRYGYHTVMMLATGWMYAMMNARWYPARTGTEHHVPPAMSSMPGMDMAGTAMPASSGPPVWFSAVNWLAAVGFAVAALFWTYWYFVKRQHEPSLFRSLGNLSQAGMAIGMSILFSATLFRI